MAFIVTYLFMSLLVTCFPYISLIAVDSLKEFGKLLSSVEDERDKIVSGITLMKLFSLLAAG